MNTGTKQESVPEINMEDINLLVADDDRDTLDMLKVQAELLGWNVQGATSASGIIDAVNQRQGHANDFDAIVADVNYFSNQSGPRLTGITAIREIRKARPDIPVIFITAFSNSLVREEIRRVDAELVPKPFNLDQLFQRIYALIYWHRSGLPKYEGTDRRISSINRSGFQRRASDAQVAPSPRIMKVLDQVRKEEK